MRSVSGHWSISILFLPTILAYKVLFIPSSHVGHVIAFSGMAEAWVEAGHEAHVIKPRSLPVPHQFRNSGIHYINHGKEGEVFLTDRREYTERIGANSQMNMIQIFWSNRSDRLQWFWELLANEDLQEQLRKNQYDFAVVYDGMEAFSVFYAIPHRLNIPYGSFAVRPPLDMMGNTLQINYLTSTFSTFYFKESTFLNRLCQFLIIRIYRLFTTSHEDDVLVRNFIIERPVDDLYELRTNSKIWLIDQDPLIDPAVNAALNMVYIGNMNTGPPKPLPEHLQQFADEAYEGLVVVSFGGSLTTDFPEHVLRSLLKGLSMIRNKVIIRLKVKPNFEIGRNILVTPWLLQSDLLGHNNTVLFVTHCGRRSISEAVYHGVPMLGFPNQYEQRANAQRFADRNYGLVMDRNKFTPEELRNTVQRMLNDTKWKNAITKSSSILKSRRFTPREAAVYWIDHVIKYGGEHLIPPYNKLAWYEVLMFDIIAAILVFISMCAFILYQCCKSIVRGKLKQKLA